LRYRLLPLATAISHTLLLSSRMPAPGLARREGVRQTSL
jgi:hypothetical protein